jgi:HAD superfamily hydrolase (TIGR01490 family)
MTEAAFFDLDKTVIAKSSTLAFTGKLHKAGMLGRRAMLRAAIGQAVFVLFGADEDQLQKARNALLTLTKGWDQDEVEQIVSETLDEVVAPLVYAEALFLIDEHVRENRRVFIVSASPDEIVRPVARYIGVADVIATRPTVDDQGRYTGEVEFYAYGPAKAEEVRRIAAAERIDLAGSFAYSDSATDVPLLETVGHPHAVNPDKDLREIAKQRGWPVLDFSRQVALRGQLTRPVPLISAGAVATAVGAAVTWYLLRKGRPGA